MKLDRLFPFIAAGSIVAAGFLVGSNVTFATHDIMNERASAQRLQERIIELSQFGMNAGGGTDRYAYSDADIEGRRYIKGLMEAAGLDVRIDAGGNIIGHRDGTDNGLPVIMFGSHTDSVPDGGNYDGDVGVMTSIEVIEMLNDANLVTRHPLEVIDFSNEEGGLVGSMVLTGKIRAETWDEVSHSGLTLAEGTRRLGGDPDNAAAARYDPADLKAFVELHIEQGGFLHEEGINIGVVEGIVGIHWRDVIIEGIANHGGTTPMDRRNDALVSAAELILAVNRIALETEGRQVATVGRIRAFPGAPNVVPGRVEMSLEIRDLDMAKMESVFEEIELAAQHIAAEHGTPISFRMDETHSEPTLTDPAISALIAESAEGLDLSVKWMPSGAGHDAQDMATITPTGMIFVPSRDGISHSPQEFTAAEDMANGADVLLRTILKIDDSWHH
jgi:beta-ureidopropionase / N-carbamoyl-L-amino-acid hydrolase